MSDRYGQGLPPSNGWQRDMTGPEVLYTQADLDFFAANADEYFAKWLDAERRIAAAMEVLAARSPSRTERGEG